MSASSEQSVPDAGSNREGDRKGLLREFVGRLPLMPPAEMAEALERCGYKGQTRQRAALALMAYRHVRRLKRIYVEGWQRTALPPKQNVLMVGPTGCGKSYLVELLFQRLLGIPTVILDATSFTERGYVGDDVSTMLTRLVERARGDTTLASCGVICLDEFDKLASSSSSARFAGQGTTKDVSGYGVQRELLTLIEGTDALVPMDYGFSGHGPRLGLSTRDIPFIACGAFSGLELWRSQTARQIGFSARVGRSTESVEMPDVAVFQGYGFIPELIGRFTQTLYFPALDKATLTTILLQNVLPRFQNEFRSEGIDLRVTDEALSHIVNQAAVRGTGARGLQTELVGIVERAACETFMRQMDIVLTITSEGGKLRCVPSRSASIARHGPTSNAGNRRANRPEHTQTTGRGTREPALDLVPCAASPGPMAQLTAWRIRTKDSRRCAVANYELTGTVKAVMDPMKFDSGFTKREFVVTTDGDRYPQAIKFECVKDRTELLDGIRPGQRVTVSFDLRGNEHKGRYFVSLSAWKVKIETASADEASEVRPPLGQLTSPIDEIPEDPEPF